MITMPLDHECMMESRIEALEEANKNHSRTHEGMYDRIRHLETENAVQNAHYSSIAGKLDELTVMVKELAGKSGKRWDSMVDKVLWLIAGSLISLLLLGMGLPL